MQKRKLGDVVDPDTPIEETVGAMADRVTSW